MYSSKHKSFNSTIVINVKFKLFRINVIKEQILSIHEFQYDFSSVNNAYYRNRPLEVSNLTHEFI